MTPGAPPVRSAATPAKGATRITSIDALRGLVMFTMIFVNDLAGVSHEIVPDWMRHFHGKSGMTFVDMVFPAFLFIVGMSIPFALGGRLRKGEPFWRILLHVLVRTISLLAIGIMMVNDEQPGTDMSGLSPTLWSVLMYLSAMLAFCIISPPGAKKGDARWGVVSWIFRGIGMAGMLVLAFLFRGDKGQRIITLSPFSIHTDWYGILGLIGWAYLVGAIVYLTFKLNRSALVACIALLFCCYPADKSGFFDGFWLNNIVGIGETLGSQAAITVAGILLVSILLEAESTLWPRVRFTLFFIAACAGAAFLVNGLYGINKNEATPSWCLWACVFTGALWLIFHLSCDNGSPPKFARILAVAGSNVLLAYLLSEMLPSFLDLIHAGDAYGAMGDKSLFAGISRSAGCGIVLLAITSGLNRLGFRLAL
jgi:heparan-alpha-glucosaminide N-acetyltransferase